MRNGISGRAGQAQRKCAGGALERVPIFLQAVTQIAASDLDVRVLRIRPAAAPA